MGDAELILVVLVMVYLSECLVWIPQGAVLFATTLGNRFRIRYPGTLPGNHRGSLYLAWPIPPLGTLARVPACPFTLTRDWLIAWPVLRWEPNRHPARPGPAVRWEAIQTIEVRGCQLIVNQVAFLKADTPENAWRWCRQWRRIAKAPSAQRSEAVEAWLQRSLQTSQARLRWDRFLEAQRPVRWLANAAFVFLFVAVPLLLLRYELATIGVFMAAGLLLQTWNLSFQFRRLHREMLPDREEERFKTFLTMLLSPPSALRAVDALSKNLWTDFHVLTAAHVLLSKEAFQEMAGKLWRELHFPLAPIYPSELPELQTALDDHRALLKRVLGDWFTQAGLDPSQMLQPPQPSEPEHAAYCPRCLEQFVNPHGRCRECGDRPLTCLPAAKEKD